MATPDANTSQGLSCPSPQAGHASSRVMMGHGGGGLLSQQLIREVFGEAFGMQAGELAVDAAVVPTLRGPLAFTTDAFVVQPLFFPGGSIGDLAVNGTVNDLAVAGAEPRFLAASFVIEEGLPRADLARIAEAMGAAAREAGVRIVAGDTKVVERGHGDGVYITTSGIGEVLPGTRLSPAHVAPGDAVILSGTIADHGMAIMRVRQDLGFEADISSDTVPLHGLVRAMLTACHDIRLMRDPTRGGLASCLAEMAESSRRGIAIESEAVPIAPAVAAACEMLGLDPWLVANEGKLVAIVPAEAAQAVLAAMQTHPRGRDAVIIGRVVEDHPGRVAVRTAIGGRRIVPMPVGELLPRIC
jgi:hydrogenase expression/formation protein HypE